MQTGSRAAFVLGNSTIPAGSRAVVDIPFGKLYTHTELNIGAHVIHGRKDGPVLLVAAALLMPLAIVSTLLTVRWLNWRQSRALMALFLATTMMPEVPKSRRCTRVQPG